MDGINRGRQSAEMSSPPSSDYEALWGRCFLRGTKIQTVLGERKVENLAPGDLLRTVFGGVRPVRWIARYRRQSGAAQKLELMDLSPVRVARSALALEAPHADLFLTQGHALYLDGVLVPVGRLVNGTTITVYPAEDFHELEFYNIKLDAHDVILAEGALCETMLNADKHADNFADYFCRYGTPRSDEQPCAPILSCEGKRGEPELTFPAKILTASDCGDRIDAIRERLARRAPSCA